MYYQISSLALALCLPPSDLKLITGLFVLAAIGLPILRGKSRPGFAAG